MNKYFKLKLIELIAIKKKEKKQNNIHIILKLPKQNNASISFINRLLLKKFVECNIYLYLFLLSYNCELIKYF